MKRIIILALALFATSAFAVLDDNSTNQNQLQGQAQGQVQGTWVGVNNRIDNSSRAAANAFVASNNANSNRNTAYGGMGVGGSASGGASGAAASNTFSIEYPQQVAGVALGSLYPSAPCMGTSNVGGGNPFFNIAVGTSWESKECQIRETARSFSAVGLTNDAIAILCSSEYAAVAPSCAKTKE